MNTYYCPLVAFKLKWDVDFTNNEFNITKYIKIIQKKDLPSLNVLSDNLTSIKISQYEHQVHYWLCLKNDYNEIEEIINVFQLVLWIIKPTEFNIRFFSNFDKDCSKQKFRNLLSRFVPIHNHFDYEYNNIDLTNLKIFFPIMMDLYGKYRVKNSIVLNYHGCITNSWETAYILFVTAFEALLSDGSERGIKRKLAWAYAILTETDNEKRQKAFDDFRDIYKIRSEILHGKSFNDKYNESKINLKELAKCRDMLRKLWQVILNSDEIIKALSEDDKIRRDYFKTVANGWMPKENNENKE